MHQLIHASPRWAMLFLKQVRMSQLPLDVTMHDTATFTMMNCMTTRLTSPATSQLKGWHCISEGTAAVTVTKPRKSWCCLVIRCGHLLSAGLWWLDYDDTRSVNWLLGYGLMQEDRGWLAKWIPNQNWILKTSRLWQHANQLGHCERDTPGKFESFCVALGPLSSFI